MKKTLLSFLCIGSAYVMMAQTTPSQQTRPSTEPSLNRNTTTTPTSVNNQQPTNNSTLNNTTQQPPVNSTLNNTQRPLNQPLNQQPINTTQQPNSTLNNSTQQQNGAVNGHNTIMDANRNYPGNNNLNNTQPNSTLNGGTTPNGNLNNSSMNTMNNGDLNNGAVTGSLNSTTANAAYSVTVPTSVQSTFTTAYPAAGNAIWSQSGDWYRARYMENGKLMEASYREDGKAFTRPASPIMRSYVPEETVSKALEMYGMSVYAIGSSKGADGQMRYNVTIIENGQARTEWMNEDGSSVMNPYRTEMDEQSANQQMNTTNGQQATDAVTPEQSATENSTNSATPATDPKNNSNMNTNGTQQQSTLQQSNTPQNVTPDNRMNNNGIMNGTGSDTLQRKRNETPKQQ